MSAGEEGPERPSAPEPPRPELPRPETPQKPAEPAVAEGAEPAAAEAAESGRPRLLPVWILLGAAALSGGAWAVMDREGGGGPPSDDASVPLIAASTEPWKVRPDDPGGMEIPNQGTLIYETLTTADPEEAPERILPPPEEPLSPPQPETDRAEELAVAASGVARDDGALQPDAGGVEEQTLAPAGEAALSEPETATEPDMVEAALSPEDDDSWPDSIVRPHPPKPGSLAALQAGAERLSESDRPATAEELPELEPETVALLEELLERDSGEPSGPARQEYVDGVPLPVSKPARVARAAPAEPSFEETVTSEPETTLDPVQSGSRTWRYVQLGAANARGPLEGHWEMLRQRHGDVLVGLSPLIMPVDSGDSGITYRLRAGPLSDAGAAQRVCAQLKERGLACFVPRD